MRSIYEGRNSCYALKRKVYVKRFPGKGIRSLAQAAAIASLLLWDYRRKRTFNHECREVGMTKELFEKRLDFLVLLAERHSSKLAEEVRKLVKYVLRHEKIPKRLVPKVLKLLKSKGEGKELKERIRRWLSR